MIEDGIAFLDPGLNSTDSTALQKYEQEDVVSSYLWSHYGDLLNDENASDAYQKWSAQVECSSGINIDLGGAVGRFTFEMSRKCELAVGIDNSVAFIKTARELQKKGAIKVWLKEEGEIRREVTIRLPDEWQREKVEFIVGDALKIPFKSDVASTVASLNLVDKVPLPIHHLEEMNRVAADHNAQFLLSDPFSWSEEATSMHNWLGGTETGAFAGKGLENITTLLQDRDNVLAPAWQVENSGHVWWKIRTHRNHYELIKSCFVKARR